MPPLGNLEPRRGRRRSARDRIPRLPHGISRRARGRRRLPRRTRPEVDRTTRKRLAASVTTTEGLKGDGYYDYYSSFQRHVAANGTSYSVVCVAALPLSPTDR